MIAAMRAADTAYGHPPRHAGAGMRRFGNYLECRDALDQRLLFVRAGDALVFHFYGNHDEVRAFARNQG